MSGMHLDDRIDERDDELDPDRDPDDEYDPEEAAKAYPVTMLPGADGLPNLLHIPQERWLDVLRPLRPSERLAATRTVPDHDGFIAAQLALNKLHAEDHAR